MYTMPHRLTVAGEATARSSTSNIMVMESLSWMISPLTRHSFLLSSSTCPSDTHQMDKKKDKAAAGTDEDAVNTDKVVAGTDAVKELEWT